MTETLRNSKDVALAAMTNLIRLMGAELVAGRHRDNLALFEQAMRAKISAVPTVHCTPKAAKDGLALAGTLVEQALAQIRLQAISAQATVKPAPPSEEPVGSTILH